MNFTTKATLCLTVLWFSLSSSIKDPSNPPTGNTGAPNETTCQQSGCHGGGSYTGTVTITGVPDTVVANTTYTITLTNTSNAVRAGFQMVCLDALNAQCGTFTNGTGTSIGATGGKQYIRQSQVKIMTGGSASWTFTWKAPATLTNAPITFYFVTLAANGDGGTSNDNVLKSSKVVRLKTTTSNKDVANSIAVNVFPNPTKDVLNIELNDTQKADLTLTDINGRILIMKNLTEKVNKINIAHLSSGIYNAQIQSNGKSVSKKIVIN
ncbi:MAG: T9SS type A sorting domain-containing protein [Saprospiraceae bacterium]|nr:T9SS type A sorting domain-containing protein [Saprospiraceae bacterium]